MKSWLNARRDNEAVKAVIKKKKKKKKKKKPWSRTEQASTSGPLLGMCARHGPSSVFFTAVQVLTRLQ